MFSTAHTELQRQITEIYQHMFYNLKVFSRFYCLRWWLWAIFRCSLFKLQRKSVYPLTQYLFAKEACANMFRPFKLFHSIPSLNKGIALLFSDTLSIDLAHLHNSYTLLQHHLLYVKWPDLSADPAMILLVVDSLLLLFYIFKLLN